MSINLKLSASASGTRNTFDRTVNFVSTYGGASGGSKATNDAALSSFNTAYAAFSGRTQLLIPPGDYDFTQAVWGSLGGDKLTITATGATLRGQLGFANSGLSNDNTHHANIVTVSAGASTVTLVTGAQTSRFTSGQWVLVTEGDLQGFGYPVNPWKFEYKQILSIGSGTLTFTAPLDKSYSSTFPNYGAGDATHIYQGGPATVYAMLPAWNQEVELVGAYMPTTSDGLFYGKTRVAKYTNCSWETYGPCPTVNVLYRMLRCDTPGTGGIEVDKLVQRMEIIDSTPSRVDFQSPSVNDLYVTGSTSSVRFRGGCGDGTAYINGLDTPEFRFGPTSYGVAKGAISVINCNSANATWSPGYEANFSDFTEAGGGVLSIVTAVPIPWAVPGAYCVLTNTADAFAVSFQVTDVTASGGTTSISTTLPFPVPGTINGKTSPWIIHPHPGADVTATNCTGSSLFTSQSLLPAHSPLFGWTL